MIIGQATGWSCEIKDLSAIRVGNTVIPELASIRRHIKNKFIGLRLSG